MKKLWMAWLSLIVAPALICNSSAHAFDDVLYVVHGGANFGAPFGGEIGTVDLGTGTYQSLGNPTDAGITGLANIGQTLYGSTSNHSLITMDASGGLMTENAFFGAGFNPADNDRINDLAYDSNTGVMYASGGVPGGPFVLYSVDIQTAELSFVGELPQYNGFQSIAFGNDVMYAHATNSPGFFDIVDLDTGASVDQIAGGLEGGALGLAYNSTDGFLYASECCLGSDGSLGERIFSLDPRTGMTTLLVDFDDGRRIHDLAFVSVIPEPSSTLLLLIAAQSLVLRRRTR